jgi:hypothetical protein
VRGNARPVGRGQRVRPLALVLDGHLEGRDAKVVTNDLGIEGVLKEHLVDRQGSVGVGHELGHRAEVHVRHRRLASGRRVEQVGD